MSPAPGIPKPSWPNRLSSHFRARRLGPLIEFINRQPKPFSILDIGGTVAFWEHLQGHRMIHSTSNYA